MKATTHTELYRTYAGRLKVRPPVERILGWAGIRLGFRRKLPALILFTPAAISAMVGCVMVHLMFTVSEQAKELPSLNGQIAIEGMKSLLGDVSENIYRFLNVVQFFAILTLTWYGSAQIAEDRRLHANLLYFARPVTPLRYILGKLLTSLAFGSLTLLLPALMICSQAAFSSPNWIFLTKEYGLILRVIGYCIMWISVVSIVVLAISSCFSRRGLAILTTFGLLFLLDGLCQAVVGITGNANYNLFSLRGNLAAIADWTFHQGNLLDSILESGVEFGGQPAWNIEGSFWALGIMAVIAGAVLWNRVKRMEVIA